MSAFIVDQDTINRFVSIVHRASMPHSNGRYSSLARLYGSPDTTPALKDLGERLLGMNVEAVHQRYPNDQIDQLPGPINPPPYRFVHMDTPLIWGYKSAQCLRYQCSEGNIPDTDEYKRLDEACNIMAAAIVAQLPEYEAAPWG